MKKTESAGGTIKRFLEMVPGIQYASIHTSFPKRPKNLESEVDVMVVGGPDLAAMDQIISKVEEELERAIGITSFTVREFRERIGVKDRITSKALRQPRAMLMGDEKELGGLIVLRSPVIQRKGVMA